MKKLSFLSLFLLIFIFNGISQIPNDPTYTYTGNGGITISTIQSKPKNIKGSVYYNNKWKIGTLELFSKQKIKDYPIRYDMKYHRIEIKTKDNVKIIPVSDVKKITYIDNNGNSEVCINCSVYKNSENKFGFYKIIYQGKISLLKKTNLQLKESNYNPTFDIGEKSKEYIKTDKYYIYTNGKISPVKKKKRQILKTFNNKAEKVEIFAKRNELSFKKDYDLSKIFNYYNNL
ncbi:MAG: hypothetical protein L3J56_08745 [Bacteroidales bacterium]|nr:hypothetical protein [Bacteroidales bacterium]